MPSSGFIGGKKTASWCPQEMQWVLFARGSVGSCRVSEPIFMGELSGRRSCTYMSSIRRSPAGGSYGRCASACRRSCPLSETACCRTCVQGSTAPFGAQIRFGAHDHGTVPSMGGHAMARSVPRSSALPSEQSEPLSQPRCLLGVEAHGSWHTAGRRTQSRSRPAFGARESRCQ